MSFKSFFYLAALLLIACNAEEASTLKFHLLPTSQTGIDFENTITENDSINLFDYYYVYNGAGVSVGDINNDDLPDLFFGGNMVSSALYLNIGEFKFQDITKEAGLTTESWIMGVTMVDVNADGLQDIYASVAGPSADGKKMDNLLFVNQGLDENGIPHFEELATQYGINDNSFSVQSAFLDYDRDGDLDLFVLTNQVNMIDKSAIVKSDQLTTNGATIDHLYENIGYVDSLGHALYILKDTTFGITHEGYGLGVAVDDLNGDNWPDIYVANDFMPNDRLYLNQQDGTYKEAASDIIKTQSYNGMGVDIADINNDLLPDIMVLDMLPDNNDRRKSMIAGMDAQKFDLRAKAGYQAQYIRNTLQLNQGVERSGKPSFSEIGQLAGIHATDWSWATIMTDFDNDSDKDIYITNGFVKDMTDLDYINFRASSSYFGTKTAKADRNKNMMNALKEVKIPNFLFQNQDGFHFQDVSQSAGVSIPSFSNGVVYADLDLDGDLDIVTNDINAPALVFENQLQIDNNYLKVKLNSSGLNKNGIGTKLILENVNTQIYQYVAPTRGYLSSVNGAIHFGLGKTSIIPSLKVIWPNGEQQLLTNIPANQTLEINYDPTPNNQTKGAIENRTLFESMSDLIPFVHEEKPHNYFDLEPLHLKKYASIGPCLSTADIDNRYGEDLFIGAGGGFTSTIYMQDENGEFQRKDLPTGEEIKEDAAALFFDFDQDEDQDLYVVSGGIEYEAGSPNYQDRLYLNDGSGNYSLSNLLPPLQANGSCVTGADFDKDGDIDLFVGGGNLPNKYPQSSRSYLLVNDEGVFKDKTIEVHGLSKVGMTTSALWSDYNQDGWVDLIVVGEWMPLTIFKNNEGRLEQIESATLKHSTGWWNVVKEGDFDNDGDMDYVAGNQGDNQDYKASVEQPFKLFADDFDQNGKIDPLFAYYLKDKVNGASKLFPFHGKDDLSKQIVAYKRIFPTYQDYSEATLETLLPSKTRGDAMTLSAKTFKSSLFINLGNGSFDRIDLPIQTQMSPINSILIQDFDEDGNLDMILAGSKSNEEYTYGGQDRTFGICLHGTKSNNFKVLSPSESGLFFNQDVNSLESLKLYSGRDVIVGGRKGGSLMTYKLSD